MGSMIDTMVLVYAFRFEHRRANPSRAQRRENEMAQQELGPQYEASSRLLKRLHVIRMSAITVVEFCRGLRDDEKAWFDKISERFDVIATDGRIAQKAADLLRGRNKSIGRTCPKYLNAREDHTCTKCGQKTAQQRRINDAIIAATAELTGRIEVLYSFDAGVQSFSGQMTECVIRSPMDVVDAAGILPEDATVKDDKPSRSTRKKNKDNPRQANFSVFLRLHKPRRQPMGQRLLPPPKKSAKVEPKSLRFSLDHRKNKNLAKHVLSTPRWTAPGDPSGRKLPAKLAGRGRLGRCPGWR